MKIYRRYWIMGFLLIVVSCNVDDSRGKTTLEPKMEIQIHVPDFNADSAYYFIEKQISFGPRVPNTASHSSCALYLEGKLKEYAQDVIIQNFNARVFNGTILPGKNIIASFNPEIKHRILLAAHWDSRPFADHDPDVNKKNIPIDGANDGASGVGVLLEIARQLARNPLSIGIDIILFDVEDYGESLDMQTDKQDTWGLGSQFWSKNKHLPDYRADFGILLDMVGASDATFTKEGYSMEYASDIVRKVWDLAAKIGYSKYFLNAETGRITDDHYYVNSIAKIPMIDIIHINPDNYRFFEHWHTTSDNLNTIDKNTLLAVGKTIMTVLSLEDKTFAGL